MSKSSGSNNKGKVQSQKSKPPRNEEHIVRTEIIVNAARNLPFLAIVFCQGGEIVKTISNLDLNMNVNHTRDDLKAAILAYANTTFCQNGICTNVANALISPVTNKRVQYSTEINDWYYGNVGSCETIDTSPSSLEERSPSVPLYKLYEEWQVKAITFISEQSHLMITSSSSEENIRFREELIQSYYNYVDRFAPFTSHHGPLDGPLGKGRLITEFYHNENNPDIPRNFRAMKIMIDELYGEIPELNKTSQISLACIVVDINIVQRFASEK